MVTFLSCIQYDQLNGTRIRLEIKPYLQPTTSFAGGKETIIVNIRPVHSS